MAIDGLVRRHGVWYWQISLLTQDDKTLVIQLSLLGKVFYIEKSHNNWVKERYRAK